MLSSVLNKITCRLIVNKVPMRILFFALQRMGPDEFTTRMWWDAE